MTIVEKVDFFSHWPRNAQRIFFCFPKKKRRKTQRASPPRQEKGCRGADPFGASALGGKISLIIYIEIYMAQGLSRPRGGRMAPQGGRCEVPFFRIGSLFFYKKIFKMQNSQQNTLANFGNFGSFLEFSEVSKKRTGVRFLRPKKSEFFISRDLESG